MRQLGFLEYAPGTDMLYEIPHAIGKLLGYLLHEYRLTSVEVVQGYLSALDRFCGELEHVCRQNNGEATARILYEADENIDRMRSDSHNNRQRIIAECVKAKINREKLSIRQRFELINHLYEKYLEPMRDMVDVNKEMDSQLERLHRVFLAGVHFFNLDRHIRQLFERSSARLLRLKIDIDNDFRESYRELMPLYERYRKESLIARGASQALSEIRNYGLRQLPLPSMLGICQFRTKGLIADNELEAYVYRISNYQPCKVCINPDRTTEKPPSFLRLNDLKQKLAGIVQIDDVLEWILHNFSAETPTQHLRIYGMFHSQIPGRISFSMSRRDYDSHGIILRTSPMCFEAYKDDRQ
jgi:hypothetical protein